MISLKLLAFSVFDSAAKAYLPPFFAPTVEVAIRRFRATVNDPSPENQIAKYPEDYTLFHCGEFDQGTGVFEPFIHPHSLGVALTFLEREQVREVVERKFARVMEEDPADA